MSNAEYLFMKKKIIHSVIMLLTIICFSKCTSNDLDNSVHVLSIKDFKVITDVDFNNLSYEYTSCDKVVISTGIRIMRYMKDVSPYLLLIFEPEMTQGIIQIAIQHNNSFYLRIFDTSILPATGSNFLIDCDDFLTLKYDFKPFPVNNAYLDCENEMYYYDYDLQWFSDIPLRRDPVKVNLAPLFISNYLVVGFFKPEEDPAGSTTNYHNHLSWINEYVNQTGLFKPVNWESASFLSTAGSDGEIAAYTMVWLQTNEQKKCSQLKEIILMLEEEPSVAFAGLVFKAFNILFLSCPCLEANIMGDLPFISVNLKNGSDISDLYAITQETNTKIFRQSGNSFTVITDKYANGSAIQMANYFNETGKFSAQPIFYFTYDTNYNP